MVRLLGSILVLSCALALGVAGASASEHTPPKQELQHGKKKRGPQRRLPCRTHWVGKTKSAKACFDRRREAVWVKDLRADGHWAVALWEIPKVRRKGACLNRWGVGTWAVCKKKFRYRKRTLFYWQAVTYVASLHGLLPGRSRLVRNWVR